MIKREKILEKRNCLKEGDYISTEYLNDEEAKNVLDKIKLGNENRGFGRDILKGQDDAVLSLDYYDDENLKDSYLELQVFAPTKEYSLIMVKNGIDLYDVKEDLDDAIELSKELKKIPAAKLDKDNSADRDFFEKIEKIKEIGKKHGFEVEEENDEYFLKDDHFREEKSLCEKSIPTGLRKMKENFKIN